MYFYDKKRALGQDLSPTDILGTIPQATVVAPGLDVSSGSLWMIAGAIAIMTLFFWGRTVSSAGRGVKKRYRKVKRAIKRIPKIRARSPLYVREGEES